MMQTPSPGGIQETVCLPLDLIPGFLFGIEVSRCKPAARPKVEAFQAHCFKVLRDHFRPERAGQPLPGEGVVMMNTPLVDDDDDGAMDGLPDRTHALWLSMVREARIINGRAAARALWAQSPLPPLPQQKMQHEERVDEITTFLADGCIKGAALHVRADALYAAYRRWAMEASVPQLLSALRFGVAMTSLGFARRKSNGFSVYVGLTLRSQAAH